MLCLYFHIGCIHRRPMRTSDPDPVLVGAARAMPTSSRSRCRPARRRHGRCQASAGSGVHPSDDAAVIRVCTVGWSRIPLMTHRSTTVRAPTTPRVRRASTRSQAVRRHYVPTPCVVSCSGLAAGVGARPASGEAGHENAPPLARKLRRWRCSPRPPPFARGRPPPFSTHHFSPTFPHPDPDCRVLTAKGPSRHIRSCDAPA